MCPFPAPALADPSRSASVQPRSPRSKVAATVSTALAASPHSDLLSAVDALEPAWGADLASARNTARRQQAEVLSRRVDLRDAFNHAASLTHLFGAAPAPPAVAQEKDCIGEIVNSDVSRDESLDFPVLTEPQEPRRRRRRSSSPISALAGSEAADASIALRNISHTLHLVRFLEAAPRLIVSATEMLDRVAEVDPPASSDLFQAHENICVCERVRDYTLLDALPNLDYAGQVADIFSGIEPARQQLEHYVMANIFSAVPKYAQTDPRLLVAAVRIVQRDEEEDEWWQTMLERRALKDAGKLVRPWERRSYEKRMHQAIVSSIERTFSKAPAASGKVDRTLRWIKKIVLEEKEASRFVVPCFPAGYEIGNLYTREYHRCIMMVVTDLFRSATGSQGAVDDDEDEELVKIVEWYREYRWGPAGASLAGSLELPMAQRDRLVAAVSRHGQSKLLAKVRQVVEEDQVSVIWPGKDRARTLVHAAKARNGKHAYHSLRSSSSDFRAKSRQKNGTTDSGICTTPGPEAVFGAIGKQIKDVRVLGVPAIDAAIAGVVEQVLLVYRKGVKDLIVGEGERSETVSEEYLCATANNMARCLEYAEDLRDAVSRHVDECSRTKVEEDFDEVIDGFRDVSAFAVAKLVQRVSRDVEPRGCRFFAPRTGTDVMLDVVEILSDCFSRFEVALMPYHFECFAGGCLRRLAAMYLAPFLALRPAVSFDEPKSSSGATGMAAMGADAVVAQLDKDVSNLLDFIKSLTSTLEKKHIESSFAAIRSVRSLFTCRPTTHAMASAHVEAENAVARLRATIGPDLLSGEEAMEFGNDDILSRVASTGSRSFRRERGLELTLGASEAIWSMRKDLKPSIVLEAVSRSRARRDDAVDDRSVEKALMDAKNDAALVAGARRLLVWNGAFVTD